MSSRRGSAVQQLPLFPQALLVAVEPPADEAPPRRRGPQPVGRNARMAERLDRMVAAAEREAAACRRAGDDLGVRRALEEARDARRAAALLRAGPAGVAEVLAS